MKMRVGHNALKQTRAVEAARTTDLPEALPEGALHRVEAEVLVEHRLQELAHRWHDLGGRRGVAEAQVDPARADNEAEAIGP